jgi:hypothetical protein
MGQQGFWDGVIPHFFKYTDSNASKATKGKSGKKAEEEADAENPILLSSNGLMVNDKICFVQLPQTFACLDLPEDFFDMRNEYGFRMSNTVRSGVGAVTSCGTNACWKISLAPYELDASGDDSGLLARSKSTYRNEESAHLSERRVLTYRFNTDTMIEDTASSHEAVLKGEKSVYHFRRDVLGARKVAADYLAAVFRWSQGAVQLFCTAYLKCPEFPICTQIYQNLCGKKEGQITWVPLTNQSAERKTCRQGCYLGCRKHLYIPIRDAWWPWIMLLVYIAPIVITTINLQMIDLDKDYPTDWYGHYWCNGLFEHSARHENKQDIRCSRENFAIVSLFFNRWYFVYALWMILTAVLAYKIRIVATFSIMLENTTYFFNAISAFFWVMLPIFMSITGTIPFRYDAAMLTFGGLWLEIATWQLLLEIKSWAPSDPMGSDRPPETALLRAQQMYFLVAPLHIYAMITGCKSGFGVRFLNRDNSAWQSFQNLTSLTIAKVWALLLTGGLIVSTGFAIVNLFIMGFKVELVIGGSTSILILSLIYEPVIAIFFNEWLTAYKKRTHDKSIWVSFSRAVCGKQMIITPKHIYVAFWGTLFALALSTNRDGVFFQRWIPKKGD